MTGHWTESKQDQLIRKCQDAAAPLIRIIEHDIPPSPEKKYLLTKLADTLMWISITVMTPRMLKYEMEKGRSRLYSAANDPVPRRGRRPAVDPGGNSKHRRQHSPHATRQPNPTGAHQ